MLEMRGEGLTLVPCLGYSRSGVKNGKPNLRVQVGDLGLARQERSESLIVVRDHQGGESPGKEFLICVL
jgi:hypothetical protein